MQHGLHRPDRCCIACHVYALVADPCLVIGGDYRQGPKLDARYAKMADLAIWVLEIKAEQEQTHTERTNRWRYKTPTKGTQ
jgi:hypothetical protein